MSTASYQPMTSGAAHTSQMHVGYLDPDECFAKPHWARGSAWMLWAVLIHAAILLAAYQFKNSAVEAPEIMTVSLLPMAPAAPTPPAPQPKQQVVKPQPRPQPQAKPPTPVAETALSQPQAAPPAPAPSSSSNTTQAASGSEKSTSDAPVSAAHNAAYLNNPRPAYPAMSRRLGEEGTVQLEVSVQADGTPAKVSIKKSSGFNRLDESALEAVRRWKFVPAKRGNDAIAQTIITPVTFTLEK